MPYTCPKCNQVVKGQDHPNKHHPKCPLANLAKKNPKGGFARG